MKDILRKLTFQILSPDEIRNKSVAEINSVKAYEVDGTPAKKGVLDLALGVYRPREKCPTCGGNNITCNGHTGHIQLFEPIIHIEYLSEIVSLLKVVCLECGAASKSKCTECGAVKPKITVNKPFQILFDGVLVSAKKLRNILEQIPDETLKKIGKFVNSRPEYMILTVLLVPSTKIRPTLILEKGTKAEDDLTHKLLDIVKINEKLKEEQANKAVSTVIDNLYNLLCYYVTTYINNGLAGVPVALHRRGQVIKGLAQRINGKQGRVRYNLSGKRVDFSCRSVITADVNIQLEQIAVPLDAAKILTKPVFITNDNLQEIKTLIQRYPDYPCVLYIDIPKEKKKIKVLASNKDSLAENLTEGMVVHRQIMNDDMAIVNRQPTLHKGSIMGHKIIVKDQKTIGLHPCACFPYNADFDGDEMNLHICQNSIAQYEVKELMGFDKNYISPKNGRPMIGCIQDAVTGLYLLSTTNKLFTKLEQLTVVKNLKITKPLLESADGRYVLSLILPNNLTIYLPSYNVVIENGYIKSGTLNKTLIGTAGSVLFNEIYKQYGTEMCYEIIKKFIQIGINACYKYGITYSYKDNVWSDALAVKVEAAKKQLNIAKIEGKSKLLEAYGKFKNTIVDIIKQEVAVPSILMVRAGSAGSLLNFVQITSNVGVLNFNISRNNVGFDGRLHSLKLSSKLIQYGWIDSSYAEGLTGIECFEIASAARDALIEVYIKTATCGYLHRKVIGSLQDVIINKYSFVKDGNNRIIQLLYSYDGLDPSKISSDKPIVNLYNYGLFLQYPAILTHDVSDKLEVYLNELKGTPLFKLPRKYLEGVCRYCIQRGIPLEKILDCKQEIMQVLNDFVYPLYEPVGILTAHSIGEPATQMNLHTKHHTSAQETQLSTGLSRLLELLNMVKNIKTPFVKVTTDSEKEAKEIISKYNPLKMKQLGSFNVDYANHCIVFKVDLDKLTDNHLNMSIISNRLHEKTGIACEQINDYTLIIKLKDTSFNALYKLVSTISNISISICKRTSAYSMNKNGQLYEITFLGGDIKNYAKLASDNTTLETNEVKRVYELYGISVAKYCLYKELSNILESQGLNVDRKHCLLVADVLCHYGFPLGVSRSGIVKYKQSPLAQAAFETAVNFFVKATVAGSEDLLEGNFENAIVGKPVKSGTEMVNIEHDITKL